MDISIIVPVYNVEKYLIRCLNSIFNQQFSGTFEVIAVDDASTDRSLQILYEYQKQESRLTVIAHEINKKLSITRTTGISASKGEYIMHVDSDDWLLPDSLERIYSICVESNADVVVYNVMREDEAGNKIYPNKVDIELKTNDKLKIQKYFLGGVVNKITRRRFIEDRISGTIGVNNAEDLLYCFELLLKANTFYLTREIFYVYFINSHSLTWNVQPEIYIQDQLNIIHQLDSIVEHFKAETKLTENVLNYFENWLYLMIARMQFGQKLNREKSQKIVTHFRDIPILNSARIARIESAMKNKFFVLKEVANRWSVRTALGIIYRSFRNRPRTQFMNSSIILF